MDRPQQGPGDVEPRDRLAVLANAVADAKALMARGEHETDAGAQLTVSPQTIDQTIQSLSLIHI